MDILGPIGWSDIATAPTVTGHPILAGCWVKSNVDVGRFHDDHGWAYIVMLVWADSKDGWCMFDVVTGAPVKFRPKTQPTHWRPMDTPDGSDYMGNYAKNPT